ncbi:hypothetical protein ACHAWF_000417 [Thalassiosira exigua]
MLPRRLDHEAELDGIAVAAGGGERSRPTVGPDGLGAGLATLRRFHSSAPSGLLDSTPSSSPSSSSSAPPSGTVSSCLIPPLQHLQPSEDLGLDDLGLLVVVRHRSHLGDHGRPALERPMPSSSFAPPILTPPGKEAEERRGRRASSLLALRLCQRPFPSASPSQ